MKMIRDTIWLLLFTTLAFAGSTTVKQIDSINAKGGSGVAVPSVVSGHSFSTNARSTFSNTNYTGLSTDREIAQIGTLTSPATVTLPAASSVSAGQRLMIVDESGSVTGTNYITIAPHGTDDINGANSSVSFRTAYEQVILISDGSTNWFYALYGIRQGGTGLNSIPSSGQNLVGNGSSYSLVSPTQEFLSSQCNSSATSFTLANTPSASLLVALYLDGVLLKQGAGLDYTISGATITMLGTACATGQVLYAIYSH